MQVNQQRLEKPLLQEDSQSFQDLKYHQRHQSGKPKLLWLLFWILAMTAIAFGLLLAALSIPSIDTGSQVF